MPQNAEILDRSFLLQKPLGLDAVPFRTATEHSLVSTNPQTKRCSLLAMCDSLNNEIGRLANSLKINLGGLVAGIAALVYVSTCVFGHYGDAHGTDLTPLLHVQRRCVDACGREHQLDVGCLDAALAELQRVNNTVAYLAAVPE